MTASELFGLLDGPPRSILEAGFSRTGADPSRTLVIGLPELGSYTDGSLGVTINDWNFIATMPFIVLRPKDFDGTVLSFIQNLLNLSVNTFKFVDNIVNPLLIFPTDGSSLSFSARNDVDTGLLQEMLQLSSQLGTAAQEMGWARALQAGLKAFGDFMSKFGLTSGVGAFMYSLAGYRFEMPKIWENGAANVNLSIKTKYKLSDDFYDPERVMATLNALKAYCVPRSLHHLDQSVANLTTNASQGTNTQSKSPSSSSNYASVNLSDFAYKYPYYCTVYLGSTGGVIHELAMVTECTIDYNVFDLPNVTVESMPQIVEISLDFTSIFPYRATNASGSEHYNETSAIAFEKVIEEIAGSPVINARKEVFSNNYDIYRNRLR